MRWNFADELVPMHSKTHAPPTPNPPPRRPPCRTRTHCPVSRWPIFCIEVVYDKLSCAKQFLKAHVVGMRRGAKGFEFDDFLMSLHRPTLLSRFFNLARSLPLVAHDLTVITSDDVLIAGMFKFVPGAVFPTSPLAQQSSLSLVPSGAWKAQVPAAVTRH